MSGPDREPQRPWPEAEDVVPIFAAREETIGPYGTQRRPPRLTAADFTAERMLRQAARAPEEGWRRTVYQLSGGKLAIAPSAAELRKRELVVLVKTPVVGCRTVAFVSRKGGVGKTTTCLLVGHMFASHRGDRVVAIDANPDAGTLGQRLQRESGETIATLLHDRAVLARYADVRAYSSQAASRLEVIAGDDRADTDEDERATVREAVGLLERHYNLVCLDTAAGVLSPTVQGVLGAADQLVIVSPTALDGARAASSTLDWLEDHGYEQLVASAAVALNAVRAESGAVDLDRIEKHFAARCRACIRVPWDPHLDTGADVSLNELRPETRQAYLELAAAIAAGFAEPNARGL